MTLSREQQNMIWEFVKVPEVQLSLNEIIRFGRNADRHTLVASALFLQKDLPIRLAKRIRELESLPLPMYSTRSIKALAELYEESFIKIAEHPPPKMKALEEQFSTMLAGLKNKHNMVQTNIASAFLEMTRQGVPKKFVMHEDVQDILSRFYTGRIGMRTMIDQHMALRLDSEDNLKQKQAEGKVSVRNFVGCIMTNCRIYDILMDAVEDARAACKMHLKDAPSVLVDGNLDLCVQYHPEHLYIIVFELIKNSLRATVELHGRQSNSHQALYGDDLPPTRITIGGGSDCYIRISDRGGGIPPKSLGSIWSFGHSTAPQGMGELAGYGHGLPLSRLYARYWGGDIQVLSLENHGVDCHIRLGVPANGFDATTADWAKRERAGPEGASRQGNLF